MASNDIAAELIDRIKSAAAKKQPLRIRGHGSKDFYGESLAGEVLDVSGHSGIISYEPTELVITVRCGTPIAEVEVALDARGQMLAFEPPVFGRTPATAGTIGGAVAAGLGGPQAGYSGRPRDFVLGAKLIDGRGQPLSFGGQVMKNVAGYDVSRLLAGSFGVLGVMTELSLKVLPKAPAVQTLQFAFDEATAIRKLNEWGGQPLPIVASCWKAGQLSIRLAGAKAAVDAAARRLGGKPLDNLQAQRFWRSLRDQTEPFFTGAASLVRLAVPPATPPLGLVGEQIIEWGGGQRWVANGDVDAARAAAHAAGGHAVRFRGGRGRFMSELQGPLLAIHQRLKAEFDPSGIFNPKRMAPEF
ncbi:glycolate oxidase [beta proteobacterium AAP99]|nr:glycolate oxidase [beta proteobacterium AAP99]